MVRAALRDPERLRALDATKLLDRSGGDDRTAGAVPDDALARVARLAARVLNAPVAQVNLITADAQIPHAAYVDPTVAAGDPTAWRGPVTLAASLCQFVVADGRPFVVEDARVDPRARDSEAVTRAGLVGYCSVPLRVPGLRDGASDPVIGSVCVVDFAPRQWTAADVAALDDLAVIAGTEVARATAERRERALANATPQIVWTVAPDGRTTSTNRRWREYTGQSADAALAGGTDAYVHPDDRPAVSAAWRRRLPGGADEGQDFAFEYRLRGADGSYRWHLGRAVAERDAQGAIVRWVGTGTDVDDQKRHEAALAEANEQLAVANAQLQEQQLELELSNQQLQEQAGELEARTEELLSTAADLARETEAARAAGRTAEAERARAAGILEGMADAYFALDAEFRITAVNAAMERGSGLTRDRLLGRVFWELFPGAVGTAFEHNYRLTATERVATRFTHDYSDGRLDLVVEVDAYPLDGGGLTAFWRDITARVQTDAALRASEARYRSLFDSIDEGFCVVEVLFEDAAGGAPGRAVDYRFLETNPAFEQQTGLVGALGRTALEVVPGLERYWFETYGRVATSREPLRFEGAADVMGRTFDVFAFPSGAPAERRVAMLFTDVSAARAAERERERLLAAEGAAREAAEAERARAAEANQAKSQFLANMSHELRTPLNAIGGYVQLLELGLHGPVTGEQQTALGRVQKAQQHLLALINDILNYAKLEGGRVEYDLREVDVRDVVADVTPLVEPQLAAKGLTFEVRLPAEPCVVLADREKLGQVLVNLLSNAAKFTDARHPLTGAPGRVTVELMARADEPQAADAVYLRVADTGRGIPREKQESIFEPFVQVRTGYAQATEGTGLGLAISRDLARGMGGDLRVRSIEGVGSTFTVTLRCG